MWFKTIIILFKVFLMVNSLFSQSHQYKDCFIELKNDTLILGNSLILQKFSWNNGNLIPLSLHRKDLNIDIGFPDNKTTDFYISEEHINAHSPTIKVVEERFSSLDPIFLQVKIEFSLNDLMIKRIIEIHPETPAITSFYKLKGQVKIEDYADLQLNRNLEMIEDEKVPKAGARLGFIPVKNPHWSFDVIEFKEATDHHNTLVQVYKSNSYNVPQKLSGNIIIATNELKEKGLFILKESPLGFSQQVYHGYDFDIDRFGFKIIGLGIPLSTINEENWTPGYGYTVGFNLNCHNTLTLDLIKYQKRKRALLRNRDQMILSNTWGDRSRDSRMNEDFILKEIEIANLLGITHVQLDDGWQQGLSKNSDLEEGENWDDWSIEDWQPHSNRFPNGFRDIVEHAKNNDVEICLWFNPSKSNDYFLWERDAEILIRYYQEYGIRVFKIDGIELMSKDSEINLRRFFEKVKDKTDGNVVFNLDVTAGKRMGYFYFMQYGNLFLENRYTDWANYYPHSTLRNIWMLSRYIPAEKFQVEFLNKWRNAHRYQSNDPLAPINIPFDYQVAISFPGQPLAWMELSQLPQKAYEISELLDVYKQIQHDFHKGLILPIGNEPNGLSWTGFQSIHDNKGFFLVFRELNKNPNQYINTYIEPGKRVELIRLSGHGDSFQTNTDENGKILFSLPNKHTFALYKYIIYDNK